MSYYPEDYYIPPRKLPVTFRSIPITGSNYYDNHIVNKPVSSSTRYISGAPSGYSSLSPVSHRTGGGVWRTDGFSRNTDAFSHVNDVQFDSYRSLPTVAKVSQPSYNPGYGYIKNSSSNSRFGQRAANGLKNKSRSQYDLSSTLSEGRYDGHADNNDDDEIGYGGRNGDFDTGRRSNGSLAAGHCVGLLNLGNTCFMNSVLQCLANTRPLVNYFLNKNYERDVASTRCWYLVTAFAEVMCALWNAHHAIPPDNFRYEIGLSAKSFAGYSQHDAQEFLIYLLQRLNENLNRVSINKSESNGTVDTEGMSSTEKADILWEQYLKHENSVITDLFMGQLRSQLKCGECGHTSNTFDPCLGLSLPIKKSYAFQESTLMDCFELYSQEEKLDGQERTMCDKCKKKQKSNKQLSIHRFPKILIIHLKRFSKTRFGHSKLTTKVKCPFTLDLSRFSSRDKSSRSAVYDLYAVCNHYGSVSSGHYTATAKSRHSGQWYFYDDDKVAFIPETRAISSDDAYILFYELSSLPPAVL